MSCGDVTERQYFKMEEKFKKLTYPVCICEWGKGWKSCKNYENKNKKGYGGCLHWIKTDFYADGERHPGWCKRIPEIMFEENDELFIL